MPVCLHRHASAARRAAEKADLHEIRLVNIFESDGFLADGCGERVKTDRTTSVVKDDALKHPPVNVVKTKLVYFECAQSNICAFFVDGTGAADLCEVAHTAQQTVCDTRRTAAAAGDFEGALVLTRNIQNAGRAFDDAAQLLG